uniref:Outer capsid protein VP2 n=1 Tax=Bluetongue virus 22 TaxID=248914 RepID=A5HW20_BTV|nr:VP2 protein [Bluetongue virus 22]
MEDFPICAIERESVYDEDFIMRYPVIVDLKECVADRRNKTDVSKLEEIKGVCVRSEGVRVALTSRPDPLSHVITPSALNVLIQAYDRKHKVSLRKRFEDDQGVTEYDLDSWVKKRLEEQADLQAVYHTIDANRGKLKFKTLMGTIRWDSNYAETVGYDYAPVSKAGCNHGNEDPLYDFILSGAFQVSKTAGYTLKQTYRLTVRTEVRENNKNELVVNEIYTPGVVRGEQIRDMKSVAYTRFRDGWIRAIIQPQIVEELRASKDALDRISNEWYSSRNTPDVVEICRIVSSIGRRMWNSEETPVDDAMRSRVFQEKLRLLFRVGNSEYDTIQSISSGQTDLKKFYALLAIAATDSYRWRIWWSNPYPCLRGTIIACEMEWGDVYKTLRSTFRWSLRPEYANRSEIDREKKAYPYQRINLFESKLTPGTRIINWLVTRVPLEKPDISTGRVCMTSTESDYILKIDDARYKQMISQIIERGWEKEQLKFEKIVQDDGNVFKMEFEKDACMDEKSHLVMPYYYDKEIHCPIYHQKIKITEAQIANEWSDDPWVNRVVSGYLGDHVETYGLGYNHIFDTRVPLKGNLLEQEQEISSYHEHLRSDESRRMTLIARCESFQNKAIRMLFIAIYKKLIHHIPKEEYATREEELIQYISMVERVRSWDQFIVFIFDFFFENRKGIRTMEEATQLAKSIRGSVGAMRWTIFSNSFPTSYRLMKQILVAKKWGDCYIMNFLPLLICGGTSISYLHREWSYPMIVTFEDGIKIVPTMVGRSLPQGSLGEWVSFISFFMGTVHEKIKVKEDELEVLRRCVEFYRDVKMVDVIKDTPVRMTKYITCDLAFGSGCGGISESISFILPVTHPNRSLVIFVISDDKLSPSQHAARAKRRFKGTCQYIDDVIVLQMKRPGLVGSVWSEKHSKIKVCRRNFLNYDHKVILTKFAGLVYGNYELLTKLANL